MPPGRDAEGGATRYFLGFTLTTLILGGLTLFLVLVVLPQRYMLSVGLVESGASFPTEAAPFSPPEELRQEARPLPPPPPEPARGPAEIFWDSVDPLLAEERLEEALPLFAEYLSDHPEDTSVRREYAVTLARAGHPQEAVRSFQEILSRHEDPDLRLLLARSLRDLGRLNQASGQYSLLADRRPEDPSLPLEWGQALAWGRRYTEASEVLEGALERFPSSGEIRLELARVYYWSDRLEAADRMLAGLKQPLAGTPEVMALRDDVVAALTPPEEEVETPPSPPSLLDRAATAVAEEDYELAADLYAAAVAEAPENVEVHTARADLLQYRLDDLEGARESLLTVEKLAGADPALRYRLAQLDVWTGRNEVAEARLRGLLDELEAREAPVLEPDSTGWDTVEIYEVKSLLGDLRRWSGDRVEAAQLYEEALRADSVNRRAEAGLREVEAEASREIRTFENLGMGANAYAIFDSDDFSRVDLGAEGVRFAGDWVWRMRAGQRWLEGSDLFGAPEDEQGLFLEMESARWWRRGTIRSGLSVGLEQLRPGRRELVAGVSLHFGDLGGFRTDLSYEHGPAYPLVLTLQSLENGVTQDRLSATLSRGFGPRWSVFVAADATRISTRASGDTAASHSLRLENSVSLGRSLSDALVLGFNARALTFTRPSPTPNDIRLFWDPRRMAAGGIYARMERPLGDGWRWNLRVNPGMAYIDERRGAGSSFVPHFSSEGGLAYLGERFRTDIDLFYYQGRFDGYRAYGMRISIRANDWLTGWRES